MLILKRSATRRRSIEQEHASRRETNEPPLTIQCQMVARIDRVVRDCLRGHPILMDPNFEHTVDLFRWHAGRRPERRDGGE